MHGRPENLGRTTARSASWLLLRFTGRQSANTIAFFVVAALLTPYEYGIGTIAVSGVMILRIALMRGLRDVVIQRETLSPVVEDTAWWLNFGLGCLLMVLVIVTAPLFALAFGDHRLTFLTIAAAPALLFTGASAVQEARIERAFRHQVLTVSQTAASFAAAGAGIGLAAAGAGAWAIAIFTLIETFGLMIVTFAQARWLPGRRFCWAEAREQIRFGTPLSLSFTLTTGNIRFAQLIVGFIAGPQATGYFRVASQINQLLNQIFGAPIVQALLPAFARAGANRARQYVRSLAVTSCATLPAFLGAAAIAPYLLPRMLGPVWQPAGEIAGILCLAIFPSLGLQVLIPLLVAMGRSRDASLISSGSVAVGLVATSVGAFWGAMGAAVGFAGRGVLTIPASLIFVRRVTGATYRKQIEAMLAYTIPALIMYGVVRLLLHWTIRGTAADWLWIALASGLGALLYAIAVRFFVRVAFPDSYEPLQAIAPAGIARWL